MKMIASLKKKKALDHWLSVRISAKSIFLKMIYLTEYKVIRLMEFQRTQFSDSNGEKPGTVTLSSLTLYRPGNVMEKRCHTAIYQPRNVFFIKQRPAKFLCLFPIFHSGFLCLSNFTLCSLSSSKLKVHFSSSLSVQKCHPLLYIMYHFTHPLAHKAVRSPSSIIIIITIVITPFAQFCFVFPEIMSHEAVYLDCK